MFCSSSAVTSKVKKGLPTSKLSTMEEKLGKINQKRRVANQSNVTANSIFETFGNLD